MNPFKTFEKQLKTFVSEKSINFYLPNLWADKHRFYHNINHLIQILQDIEKNIWFKDLTLYEKDALLLAAFMHDAIYDPTKKDNEDESIRFFKSSYISKDMKMQHIVCDLIEVTKYRTRPIGKLQKIFWDADNAGFKKGYKEILKNEILIRKEFSFVSKKEYKESRIEFLKSCIGLFGTSADKDLNKLLKYIEKTY